MLSNTSVFQKFTPDGHGLKLRIGDEIITFSVAPVARWGLVVHEIEGIVPGSSSTFCTNVDFPEPDGPETINSSGGSPFFSLIRCSAPVPGMFRFLFDLQRIPVIASASLSTPGVLESMVFASRCISCSRKSSFLPNSPAPSSNCANCCRWLRSRSNSSLISLRSASNAASCASRAGSILLPPSKSFSRESNLRANARTQGLHQTRVHAPPEFQSASRVSGVPPSGGGPPRGASRPSC